LYDRYDRRDLKMAAAPVFVIPLSQLPPVGDLREWQGPHKNQGDEGSCLGHAYSSEGEWSARKYLAKTPVFSPQFTYAVGLMMEGSFPDDEGLMPRTGCKVNVKYGFCESSLFPYIAGQITAPTSAQYANAATWKFQGAYHRVDTAAEAVACCADKTPWLFTIGMNVWASFEAQSVADTGVMPIPNKAKERLLGGHEVLGGLAWDIGAVASLRPANCPPAVLVQNSWGADWGINGDFWMPLECLDDVDIVSDMWIVHNGGP
jgi:hypothetical protein